MKILQFTSKHRQQHPEEQFLACTDCGSQCDWSAVTDEHLKITRILCLSHDCNGRSYFEVKDGKIV